MRLALLKWFGATGCADRPTRAAATACPSGQAVAPPISNQFNRASASCNGTGKGSQLNENREASVRKADCSLPRVRLDFNLLLERSCVHCETDRVGSRFDPVAEGIQRGVAPDSRDRK